MGGSVDAAWFHYASLNPPVGSGGAGSCVAGPRTFVAQARRANSPNEIRREGAVQPLIRAAGLASSDYTVVLCADSDRWSRRFQAFVARRNSSQAPHGARSQALRPTNTLENDAVSLSTFWCLGREVARVPVRTTSPSILPAPSEPPRGSVRAGVCWHHRARIAGDRAGS
jgi:hypothetical protein